MSYLFTDSGVCKYDNDERERGVPVRLRQRAAQRAPLQPHQLYPQRRLHITAGCKTSPTSSCTSLKSGVNTVSIPSFKVRPFQSVIFTFIGVKLTKVTEAGARPNFTHSAAHFLQLDNLSQSFRINVVSRIPADNRTGVPSSERRSLSSAQSASLMRAATAQRHLLFPPSHNPAPSLSLVPVVNYSPPLCQHYYYLDVFSFLLSLYATGLFIACLSLIVKSPLGTAHNYFRTDLLFDCLYFQIPLPEAFNVQPNVISYYVSRHL